MVDIVLVYSHVRVRVGLSYSNFSYNLLSSPVRSCVQTDSRFCIREHTHVHISCN